MIRNYTNHFAIALVMLVMMLLHTMLLLLVAMLPMVLLWVADGNSAVVGGNSGAGHFYVDAASGAAVDCSFDGIASVAGRDRCVAAAVALAPVVYAAIVALLTAVPIAIGVAPESAAQVGDAAGCFAAAHVIHAASVGGGNGGGGVAGVRCAAQVGDAAGCFATAHVVAADAGGGGNGGGGAAGVRQSVASDALCVLCRCRVCRCGGGAIAGDGGVAAAAAAQGLAQAFTAVGAADAADAASEVVRCSNSDIDNNGNNNDTVYGYASSAADRPGLGICFGSSPQPAPPSSVGAFGPTLAPLSPPLGGGGPAAPPLVLLSLLEFAPRP